MGRQEYSTMTQKNKRQRQKEMNQNEKKKEKPFKKQCSLEQKY
jgi:hypothetical protein